MTNEEIDKQMEYLQGLKMLNSNKTKDGVQIELGGVYYALVDLSKGFEQVVITTAWVFEDNFLWLETQNYRASYRYDQLFSSKQAGKDYMFKLLNDRIANYEQGIKTTERSLELLNALEV